MSVKEIFWLLDTDGNRNTHLKNSLNHESWHSNPRGVPLKGIEPVHGDFLVLVYCAHDPSVRLDDYDDLDAMESALASDSGIVNFLITYAVAFIHGQVRPYTVAYSTTDGRIERFDKIAQTVHGPQPAEQAKHRWIIWDA